MPAIDLVSVADPITAGDSANAESQLHAGQGALVSASGRYVVFQSKATNLVPGQADAGGTWDVFLRDRVAGTTTLVSRTSGSATTAGNGDSLSPSISADGRYVAFRSKATNLVADQVDSPSTWDVFLYDRVTTTTTLLSRNSSSSTTTGNADSLGPVISSDGKYIAFTSSATDLVSGQIDTVGTSDVFLYDREATTLALVSRTSASATAAGNASSENPSLSADGRYVVFQSLANNLVAGASDENGAADVFLYDRIATTTTLVSHVNSSLTTTEIGESTSPVISADGNYVAYSSYAGNLMDGQNDLNLSQDVFLYNRAAQTNTLVSHNSAVTTDTGDNFSDAPVLSSDGSYLAYRSAASDLVSGQTDVNGDLDIFLYDRVMGTATLVSHATESSTTAGNFFSDAPALSADGRMLAFASVATNLVAGSTDTNAALDVFVYDRVAAATTLVSHVPLSETTAGNSISDLPRLSADGRMVVFQSGASDLVSDDLNAALDVFSITLSNLPPVAEANGPYTVAEGGSVALSAVGSSDPDQSADSLTYAWDLDGDSVFGETGPDALRGDETGAAPTFSAVGLDGPSSLSVSLRVTDSGSLTATDTATIHVSNAAPTPLPGGPFAVDEGGMVALTASASDPGGDPVTLSWDLDADGTFGETGADAVRGDEVSASPTFLASGLDGPSTFTVQLRANDGEGGETTVPVNISVQNAAPSVNAGEPYSVAEGGTLVLNASAIDPAGDADSLTFTWDLDGDSVFGETGPGAVQGDEVGASPTFSAVGLDGPSTYNVQVRVDDGEGGVTTQGAAITILNAAPVVTPGGPYSVLEEGSIAVSASASDGGGAGDPLTFVWDLDSDGQFGETGGAAARGDEAGASVTFSAAGLDGPRTFTIRVRVSDNDSGVTTRALVLDVLNAAPTANAGGPYSVAEGGTIALSGSGSDVAGSSDPLTFTWDLDGDSVFGETGLAALQGDEVGAAPTFAANGLDGPGTHNVQVRVDDGDGGVTTQSVGIALLNSPPTLDPGGPYSVPEGGAISLGASGADPAGASDPLTFTWDLDNDGVFGETGADAARGEESGASPMFSASGLEGPSTFTVQVRVADGDGGVVDQAVDITIVDVPPPAMQHILATSRVWRRAQMLTIVNAATGASFQVRLAPRAVEGGVLLQVGDVNGDRVEDVAMMFRRKAGSLKVFSGVSGQLLSVVPAGAFRRMLQSGPVTLQLIDRDGDGDMEIVLQGKIMRSRTTLVFDGATGRLIERL